MVTKTERIKIVRCSQRPLYTGTNTR